MSNGSLEKCVILMIDDCRDDYEKLIGMSNLIGAVGGTDKICFCDDPSVVSDIVQLEKSPELRLVLVDVRWDGSDKSWDFGENIIKDVVGIRPNVAPIVYSSLLANDLHDNFTKLLQRGAVAWISKHEPNDLIAEKIINYYMQGAALSRNQAMRVLPVETKNEEGRNQRDIFGAVMFVDMCSFTVLSDVVREDRLIKVLDMFYELVGKKATKFGGYIDKYIGDEVMVVFGALEGDNPAPLQVLGNAVECAKEIASEIGVFRLKAQKILSTDLRAQCEGVNTDNIGYCRVGIESGDMKVCRFEKETGSEVTFVGRSVNMAARVIGKAEPTEIWVGANAKVHVPLGYIDESSIVEDDFKGFVGKYERARIKT